MENLPFYMYKKIREYISQTLQGNQQKTDNFTHFRIYRKKKLSLTAKCGCANNTVDKIIVVHK